MSKIPKALLVGALVLGSGAELAHASSAHATSQVSCDKGGQPCLARNRSTGSPFVLDTTMESQKGSGSSRDTLRLRGGDSMLAHSARSQSPRETRSWLCQDEASLSRSKDQKVEAICAQDFSVERKGTSPSSSQENLLNNGGRNPALGRYKLSRTVEI
jgi:hypothetical protein